MLVIPDTPERNTVVLVPRKPQRRKRTTPDFARVAELAADMIADSGEGHLRIPQLRKATGISNSSLYAHFGGRDGIVAAALLVLYERYYRETIGVLEQAVRDADSVDDYRHRLRQFIMFTGDLRRTPARLQRAAVFAGSQGRPEVRSKLVELTTAIVDDVVKAVDLARARGFLTSSHPSRTIAYFMQAAIFGRVITAFDGKVADDDLERWTDVVMRAIDAINSEK